jgi:ankyrin repeat protein
MNPLRHRIASVPPLFIRLLHYGPQDREAFINQLGGELLYWAAARGYTRVAELLIGAGVNVDIKDVGGSAGLHLAVSASCPQMVQLLLQAKADPSIRMSSREIPLHMATKTGDLQM